MQLTFEEIETLSDPNRKENKEYIQAVTEYCNHMEYVSQDLFLDFYRRDTYPDIPLDQAPKEIEKLEKEASEEFIRSLEIDISNPSEFQILSLIIHNLGFASSEKENFKETVKKYHSFLVSKIPEFKEFFNDRK